MAGGLPRTTTAAAHDLTRNKTRTSTSMDASNGTGQLAAVAIELVPVVLDYHYTHSYYDDDCY